MQERKRMLRIEESLVEEGPEDLEMVNPPALRSEVVSGVCCRANMDSLIDKTVKTKFSPWLESCCR